MPCTPSDNLDDLRAAILRMQWWTYQPDRDDDEIGPWYHKSVGWTHCPPDPLADDRLHELVALAEDEFADRLVGIEFLIRGSDYACSLNAENGRVLNNPDECCGLTKPIALARAIVEAKGGADGR